MSVISQLGAIPLALCDNTNTYRGSIYSGRFGSFTTEEGAILRPAYSQANNTAGNRYSFYGSGVGLKCSDGLTSVVSADAICLDVYNYIVSIEKTSETGVNMTKINIFKHKITDDTMEIIASGLYDVEEIKPKGIGLLCYNTELMELRFIAGYTFEDCKVFSFSESKGLILLGGLNIDLTLFKNIETELTFKDHVLETPISRYETYRFYNSGVYTRTNKTVAQLPGKSISGDYSERVFIVNDIFNGKIILLPIKNYLTVEIKSGDTVLKKKVFNKDNETNSCLLLDIIDGIVSIGVIHPNADIVEGGIGVMMITDGTVSENIDEHTYASGVTKYSIHYTFSFDYANRKSINTEAAIVSSAAKYLDGQWEVYSISSKDVVRCKLNDKIIEYKLATGLDTGYNYDKSLIRNICDNVMLDVLMWGDSDRSFATIGSKDIKGVSNAKYYTLTGIINSKNTEIKSLGAQEKIWVQRGEKWRCSKEGSAVYFEVNPNNEIRVLDYISTEGTVAPIDCYLGLIAGRGTVMITRQSGIKFK